MEENIKTNEEKHQEVSALKRYGLTALDIVLFVVFTFIIIVVFGGILLLLGVGKEISVGNTTTDVLINGLNELIMLIAIVVAAGIVLRIRRLPFGNLGLRLCGHGRDFVSGLLVAILIMLVGLGLCMLTQVVRITGVTPDGPMLLLNLVFFFLVAVAEEVGSRGFLLGRMLDGGVNPYAALLISSLLFSLMHFFNPSYSLIAFVNILLAGVLLGSTYLYTRNLSFPIALHWAWNYMQGPVLGFHVSGTETSHYLLQQETAGSVLLSGGEFGFEGSLLCTLLMLAFIIPILFAPAFRRKLVN